MLGRIAATVALIALAGCAGLEPAGRNAQRQTEVSAPAPVAPPSRTYLPPPAPSNPTVMPAPTPAPSLPPPAPMTHAPAQVQPAPMAQAPTQAPTAPSVAAANVAVPVPPRPVPQDPNSVVVHGSVPDEQVRPPNADPRSISERREDIRNWDHCVMQVMAQHSDPNQLDLESPEAVCANQLGQASRNAVPQSRLRVRP